MVVAMVLLCLHFLGFTRCSLVFDETNQEARKNKYCSPVGECLPGTHVMCMYSDKTIMSPRCSGGEMLPMTEAEKNLTLDLLNEMKRNVSQGRTNLPKGYGMRKLFWHDSLAEFAQTWANQCDAYRRDLCRASEEFPRIGQTVSIFRFHYPDWSLKNENFTDKSKTLTPEKRKMVIDDFVKTLHDPYVKKEQIEQFPRGGYKSRYLTAIYGSTANVGCGMSTYHDYFRTVDDDPIIFHAVEVVCNFSNEPKEGETVYETRWSYGAGLTPCGCPEGFIEDDCLCVPGRNPDTDDNQNEKEQQPNEHNDNKDKENNDKEKGDEQQINPDDRPKEDKNKENDNKDDHNKHKEEGHKDNADTCNNDPSCMTPRVVIMPIITVEDADPERLNEAEIEAMAKNIEQRKHRLRQVIKDRIKNVRDRYFKEYSVIEPGTRHSNGGPIDEDTFVLSKNVRNYTLNAIRRKFNNLKKNKKNTNIKVKDRRGFSDLDQLISEYLLNLNYDNPRHSTDDMVDLAVNDMRDNNINGKQIDTQNYFNQNAPNIKNEGKGFQKLIII
ncbi:uncharacterized protein LOC125238215 [Leguminivora glycinivorella]|uniref:uncharacterized protein LOC125238215 n=1 Tax=Leguminivora glycinivorella TaxID=1035111 RepID=UPI00200F770B|nr:uncharacterized protein LOC125238215 [Leguminivora glycinivorella]